MATQTLAPSKPSKVQPTPVADKADLEDGEEIGDIAKFWLENGILFELNRRFFHPIGFSISVGYIDEENHSAGLKLQFHRYAKDPTHTFPPDDYKRGVKKWNNFWKTQCIPSNLLRKKRLGFVVQNHPDYREDQKK